MLGCWCTRGSRRQHVSEREGRGGEGAHQRLHVSGASSEWARLEDIRLLSVCLLSCAHPVPSHYPSLAFPAALLLMPPAALYAAGAEMMVPAESSEVWLVGDEQVGFLSLPDLTQVPAGSITKQGAIW